MYVQLTASRIVAFLLLLIVMLEMHEIVHISVGYLICGCWGTRDFNVWSLCGGCDRDPLSWLPTLAGPLFSFALMWAGMLLLFADSAGKKAAGFALIFANIPFGRITTVMLGGGDEMVVMRHFFAGRWSRGQMIWFCSAVLLALGMPPVICAWRMLRNKRSWLYIAGFMTLPLLFLLLYVLGLLNWLLNKGVLATPWIMGTPLLITLHTLLAGILLVLVRVLRMQGD